jgi:hypothetical protein
LVPSNNVSKVIRDHPLANKNIMPQPEDKVNKTQEYIEKMGIWGAGW